MGELLTKNPLPLLLLFTAAVIALLYWFFGTEKGCSIRATGANQNMARAQGIDTSANVVLGPDALQRHWSRSPARCSPSIRARATCNMGRGAIVIGLAAVIIGEVVFGKLFTQLRPSSSSPFPSARSFTTSCMQAVLQLGLNTNDLKLVTALIVAVFLAIPYWKRQGVPRQCTEGRHATMLELKNNLPRPSTPAPSTRKRRSTA